MRIQVRRTGGFAGIERVAEIDTQDRGDADEWHSLAASVLTDSSRTHPDVVPDGFFYRITIDEATVYCADPALTAEQRQLITRVLKEGA
jgi:hypothetical protein